MHHFFTSLLIINALIIFKAKYSIFMYIIYFITQKKNTNGPYKEQAHYNKEHTPIADDVFDKLFEMVQYNDKQRRKTKKHTTKIANKKTKRHR